MFGFAGNAQDTKLIETIFGSKDFIEFSKFSTISKSNFVSSGKLKGGNESIVVLSFDVNKDRIVDHELFYIISGNVKEPITSLKKYEKNKVTLFSPNKSVILSISLVNMDGENLIKIDEQLPIDVNPVNSTLGYWSCVVKGYQRLKKACEADAECDTLCDFVPSCHSSMLAAAAYHCL